MNRRGRWLRLSSGLQQVPRKFSPPVALLRRVRVAQSCPGRPLTSSRGSTVGSPVAAVLRRRVGHRNEVGRVPHHHRRRAGLRGFCGRESTFSYIGSAE
jgi:hypothetical protein